jgi:hypothetical protein
MGGLISADAFCKLLKLKSSSIKLSAPLSDDEDLDSKKTKHLSLASADLDFSELTNRISSPTKKNDESTEETKGDFGEESTSWFSGWWSTPAEKNGPIVQPMVASDDLKSFPIELEENEKLEEEEYQEPDCSARIFEPGSVNIIAIMAFDAPFYGIESIIIIIRASTYCFY